jgi:hypothetical protein
VVKASRFVSADSKKWRIGEDGLVAESLGNFDAAEY